MEIRPAELPGDVPVIRELFREYAQGIGVDLAMHAMNEARAGAYQRICLDTLPSMAAAIALYRDLGFRPIVPYVFNPIPGALFLGRTSKAACPRPSVARPR